MTDQPYILVVKGSPRTRGNSSTLADQAAAGARDAGAQVECYDLHSLDIRPCDACDACREDQKGCIIEDDMQALYPRLEKADGILIASPVYWFNYSAQTKLFIDRWYALGGSKESPLVGKRFGVIMTYEDPDVFISGAVNALRSFQDMFRYLKAELVDMVYTSAGKAGEVREQKSVMEKAYRLGQKLGEL